MLSHRKGVLLDGIGSELVRASTGGARKTLSAWLSLISNLGSTAITAVMAPLVQAATKAAGWAFFALNNARTSHHGTNDAALTAAKAAAGVGGLIIVDNALVLTSTATTAGYTLRFEGGTISPPASGNTLTVGKIEASPSQQIFVGANIAQVRCNADCDGVYPEWFYGAASDFLGFAAPLAATQLASGILLRGAEYATSVKVTIGNGTNTTRSTIHNGFFMRGGSDGVGAGEFGSPNLLTSIKWTGTDSTASTVVQIDGGIHSVVLENFAINCNATAGVGILEYHKYRCSVRRVYVHNWKAGPQFAWDMAARDNAAYLSGGGAGVTQGYMENTYQDWGCRTPPSGVGNCISMAGGKTNNIGFSRNSFDNTQWVRGDDSASISLSYSFVDNNTFDDPLAVSSNALPYTGTALRRLTQSGGSFPKENSFYGCELVGAIITVDDVTLTTSTDGGQDCAYGYGGLADGAPTSMPFGFRAVTTDGRLLGVWSATSPALTTPAFTGQPTGTINSGTWTPTLTGVTNVTAVTAYPCHWMRIGSRVLVSGWLDVDPTAFGADFEVGISLPFASNFTQLYDATGNAACGTISANGKPAFVRADTANDRLNLQGYVDAAPNNAWAFNAVYEIK